MNYSDLLKFTSQTKPVAGMNMKKNNAGGYGFAITPQEQLERFLLVGTVGGTAYLSEKELTELNADVIIKLIKSEQEKVVATVVSFSVEGKAPKPDAGIFVLALCCKHGNELTKKTAYNSITTVCRTATQFFMFLANIKNLRGWSRGLRSGCANWYLSKSKEQIAYQIAKYRVRSGFTHLDAMRLSHPKAKDDDMQNILGYIAGKRTATEVGSKILIGYESAKITMSDKELVAIIKEANLTHEMIPNEVLNNPEVLKALLPNMKPNALIRNLNRFAKAGLTKTKSDTTKEIVRKLTDVTEVTEAGLHPINILNSLFTYKSGRSERGDSTWDVNSNIADALQDTFEISLKAIVPSGKNILLGVDISSSMDQSVGGSCLKANVIANVMAYITLRSEKNSDLICFNTAIINSGITRKSSLNEVLNTRSAFGGTDCSLPCQYALQNNIKYDTIVIYTDNETWAGKAHLFQVLEEYRRKVNKEVKVVEVALVANGESVIPDNDYRLLRTIGFNSGLPTIISEFSK